jgi:hypothetical protein
MRRPDPPGPDPAGPDPADPDPARQARARLLAHLARQEALCAALEALADGLPHRFDTRLGLALARDLRLTLARAHRFEERMLHPALRARDPALAPALARLRREHLEDADQAAEIAEAVAALVRDPARRDAETLGYMLRGFFVALGRHTAFERDRLLPLLPADPCREGAAPAASSAVPPGPRTGPQEPRRG